MGKCNYQIRGTETLEETAKNLGQKPGGGMRKFLGLVLAQCKGKIADALNPAAAADHAVPKKEEKAPVVVDPKAAKTGENPKDPKPEAEAKDKK